MPQYIPGVPFELPEPEVQIPPFTAQTFMPGTVDPLAQELPIGNLDPTRVQQKLADPQQRNAMAAQLAQMMGNPGQEWIDKLANMPGLQLQVPGQEQKPAAEAEPEVVQGPPKTPEELGERTTGWASVLEQLNTPEGTEMLLRFGAQMLQPKQPGQTTAGQLGQALTGTMEAYKAGQARTTAAKERKELLRLKTEKGGREAAAAKGERELTAAKVKYYKTAKTAKPGAKQQLHQTVAEHLITTGQFPDTEEGKAEAFLFARNLPEPKAQETREAWVANAVAKQLENVAALGKGLSETERNELITGVQKSADTLFKTEAPTTTGEDAQMMQKLQQYEQSRATAGNPVTEGARIKDPESDAVFKYVGGRWTREGV